MAAARLLNLFWGGIYVQVFRIRDIFGRILTRSTLWITDPDPALSVSDLQDAKKILFCLLLFKFEGTITSLVKGKSHKESQNSRIKIFLTIFAGWLKDPDLYLCWVMNPGGSKFTDSKDPEPEHKYVHHSKNCQNHIVFRLKSRIRLWIRTYALSNQFSIMRVPGDPDPKQVQTIQTTKDLRKLWTSVRREKLTK